MDSVKKALKEEIKGYVDFARERRQTIRELAWTSAEAREQFYRLRHEARLQSKPGQRVVPPELKAAWKQARRPETGEQRAELRYALKVDGGHVRNLLLAYAWLRGRPYSQVEPKCTHPKDPYTLASVLKEFLDDARLPLCTTEAAKAWLAGSPINSFKNTTPRAA